MKPHLTTTIFNTAINSFHLFGVTGYFVGSLAGIGIAYATHLAVGPVVLCALLGVLVFVGLTYIYKWITGKEDLVYYQHEIAILVGCSILLYTLSLPVLKYLDITLMGIGIFLAFGRIGCFSVGCCHGRPSIKYGVLYNREHVEEGFPAYYQGVPLFPIQLVEAICVAGITLLGIFCIFMGSEPGTAFLIYSIVYGLVRYGLEFFRGDPERPYWFGFSEAQWTTLALFIISLGLGGLGVLPLYNWHVWAVVGLILLMLVTIIFRKHQIVLKFKILQPGHVLEIATGLASLDLQSLSIDKILIAHTSLGLNISMGVLKWEGEETICYTLSQERPIDAKPKFGALLTWKTVEVIGKLLQTLRHGEESFEIVKEQTDMYHLVFNGYRDGMEYDLPTPQYTPLNLRIY